MLNASRIRVHDGEEETRHQVVSALWNAGVLTLTVLTIALVFFGVLVIRAT
ncbi:MAG TPA: hypothetical protein VME43_22100 [Bryobacteraceae bacterium]|nr:hypothetical protein [Bryobacteraceae bacterium]